MATSKEKKESSISSQIFGALLIIGIANAWWPDAIPFGFFDFWVPRGSVGEWLRASWPVFVWGGGVTAFFSLISRNSHRENLLAEELLARDVLRSILAGVGEEFCFRWLFFLASCAAIQVGNFLFFGWLGFGIAEWLQLNFFGPIANVMTFHALQPQLFHATGWAVGAGMLAANARFRNGHAYLGILGYLNSWFMGMFFFWLMFTFGLPAAMLVHFLYDLIVFAVQYLDRVLERAVAT